MGILKRFQSDAGNVFTVLLAGVMMAGAVSYGVYQTMTGPVSTMSRVVKKNTVDTQLSVVAQVVIADAARNYAGAGDCDGDSFIEPLAFDTASITGGGSLPTTLGAPRLDPWGSEYGYCVWDVGNFNDPTTAVGTCVANANRLAGSPTPTVGDVETQTVLAVISAGPDRQFQTECDAYTDSTTDIIDATTNTPNDDIILRYSYTAASSAVAALWTRIAATPDEGEVAQTEIKVGDVDDFSAVDDAGEVKTGMQGIINTTDFSATGLVEAGGGVQLADELTVTTCDENYVGALRYNDASDGVDHCDGTAWVSAAAGSSGGAGSIDELTDGETGQVTEYEDNNVGLGENAVNSITAGSGTGNTGVGVNALTTVTTGDNNTAVGEAALSAGSGTGSNNVAIGSDALWGGGGGDNNVAFGYDIGSNSLDPDNVAIGWGASFTGADQNVTVGYRAGRTSSAAVGIVAVGYDAMFNASQGSVAIGYQAMQNTATNLNTQSTAIGYQVMSNGGDDGDRATGIGYQALQNNNGADNSALGYRALRSNTTGAGNTAAGAYALESNSTASENTAAGYEALSDNAGVLSASNTAAGWQAMRLWTGKENTAIGASTMNSAGAISGDANTVAGYQALQSNTGTDDNTAIGYQAMLNATANANTAVGYQALSGGVTASNNTAIGSFALEDNTGGQYNTAVGYQTLANNISGNYNTAVGYQALLDLTLGSNNTVAGQAAGKDIVSGSDNTAIGDSAMENRSSVSVRNTVVGHEAFRTGVGAGGGADNTVINKPGSSSPTAAYVSRNTIMGDSSETYLNTGADDRVVIGHSAGAVSTSTAPGVVSVGHFSGQGIDSYTGNTVVGYAAMGLGTSGNNNTVIGYLAMSSPENGSADNTMIGSLASCDSVSVCSRNTAVGYRALQDSEGDDNTAVGYRALVSNLGDFNTAVGYQALDDITNATADNNTAVGEGALGALLSASGATAVGYQACSATNYSNSTCLGYQAAVTAANMIRIGNVSVTDIGGQVGFSSLSDGRVKIKIADSDLGLDFIMALKAVSFRMKDGNGRLDYGFIAQEVEKALEGRKTNMVTRDADQDGTYHMRGADLLAPIVKAVQEQDAAWDRRMVDIDKLKTEALRLQLSKMEAPQ